MMAAVMEEAKIAVVMVEAPLKGLKAILVPVLMEVAELMPVQRLQDRRLYQALEALYQALPLVSKNWSRSWDRTNNTNGFWESCETSPWGCCSSVLCCMSTDQ